MSNSTEKNESMKEERIECIRRSALKLFALRGYDNVRIQQIADECGCSHGLLYHYYSSKEDIFHELMEYHRNKKNRPHLFIYNQDIPAKDQIVHFSQALCNILGTSDYEDFYYFVMFTTFEFQKTLPPPPGADETFKPKSLHQILEEIILEGQKDGTVYEGNPTDMVNIIYGTIRGLIYDRLRKMDEKEIHQIDPILIERILLKNI